MYVVAGIGDGASLELSCLGVIMIGSGLELMRTGAIKEGACPELICTGAGGDTGLGDERSMTKVSVKEQMKKLVG
ncbi:hypothetical protein Tco_1099750 [Tanacetum coccineum]